MYIAGACKDSCFHLSSVCFISFMWYVLFGNFYVMNKNVLNHKPS